MSLLRTAIDDAPFTFVVGKGGTGKTTAAAALALDLADAGTDVHLISTDPAHSLSDVFGEDFAAAGATSRCSPQLRVEEFDAAARAHTWLQHATGPVTEILEAGTYLDADDVAGFTRLALPGLDEMMAVLRLVDLADAAGTVVVDTAPTGHTLRLLDAADTHETLARALRAMADKAAIVASSLTHRTLRLAGERFIDELEAYATSFRSRVLDRAAFVVAARADPVVRAETVRLRQALERRRLGVAAVVHAGDPPPSARGAGTDLYVAILADATGCHGLRAWRDALRTASPDAPATPATAATTAAESAAADADATAHDDAADADAAAAADSDTDVASADADAAAWLRRAAPPLLVFAGKGGVGKSTCAAAAAVLLARDRDVLLCSTDPAGSLDDVFAADVISAGSAGPRLRTQQVDAAGELRRLREEFRDDVLAALDGIGLSSAAAVDRRVVEALWDLAPPGIDEFAALAALLDAADTGESIVLDTAPTGHFLRLLTMPDVALDWVRQLMRIIVKYHAAGSAGGVAESLLRTARELRALRDLLHDGARAAVVIVTLDEPVVRAETARLHAALAEADVAIAATLVNRAVVGTDPPADEAAAATGRVIRAPLLPTPPAGRSALRKFVAAWKIGA
jgi:arsenite/tail-anchored protein-transporting ATPase